MSTAVDITQKPSGSLARQPRRTKRLMTADPKLQTLQAVGVPWLGVTGRPEVFGKVQVSERSYIAPKHSTKRCMPFTRGIHKAQLGRRLKCFGGSV